MRETSRVGVIKPESISISFCGLPGSGKTTIAAELRECLTEAGWTVDTGVTSRSWFRKLKTITIHRHFVRQMTHVLATSPRTLRDRLAAARLTISSLERFSPNARTEETRSIQIIDESTVQRLFTLLVDHDGVHNTRLSALVATMPVTNVIIRVHADRELIHRRLDFRSRAMPQRLQSSANIDSVLDEAEKMFDDATELLGDRVLLLHVASPDDNAPELIYKKLLAIDSRA